MPKTPKVLVTCVHKIITAKKTIPTHCQSSYKQAAHMGKDREPEDASNTFCIQIKVSELFLCKNKEDLGLLLLNIDTLIHQSIRPSTDMRYVHCYTGFPDLYTLEMH